MDSAVASLKVYRRLNLVAFLLLILLSLLDGRIEMVGGVVAGGLVSIINFELLARLGAAFLRSSSRVGPLVFGVMFKFSGLMVLVGILLTMFPLNPIAFAVGFSVILLAIGAGALLHLTRVSSQNPESSDA